MVAGSLDILNIQILKILKRSNNFTHKKSTEMSRLKPFAQNKFRFHRPSRSHTHIHIFFRYP